jgi:Galactose mutarotase and related enzymes
VAVILLENAHLRMRVTTQGAAVLSLDSVEHQQPVLRAGEGKAPGDCGLFPMLPLANRVAGNRFLLNGQSVELPQSRADERFFLHGDGWIECWDLAQQSGSHCVLQLRQQHACGFDYQAEIRYQLSGSSLEIALKIFHLGKQPMLYGGGLHPFFHLTAQSEIQFSASGYWPEGALHLPLPWTQDIPAEANFSASQYGTDQWLNVGYSGWSGKATNQTSTNDGHAVGTR